MIRLIFYFTVFFVALLTACKSIKMHSTYEGKYIHISKDLSDTTFLVLIGDSTFVFYGNIYPPSSVGQNWLCQSVKGSWTPKRNRIELKRNTEVFDDNKLGLAQFQRKGACIYLDSVELQLLNSSNGLTYQEEITFFSYSTDTVVYFVKSNKDGVIYFSPKPNEALWISLDAVGRYQVIRTSNFDVGFSYKFQYIDCYPLFDKKEILLIKSGYLFWDDGVHSMKFLRINNEL